MQCENTSLLAKSATKWTKKASECVEMVSEGIHDMQPIEATDQNLAATLTALDRCDVCGAQAYIRASLATGDLLFCAHHGKANKEKLEPISKAWLDETDKLLAR
jgi:hypothetical protein